MKIYTDLDQSKILSDILPIESADMSWVDYGYCKQVLPKDDVDANAYPIIIPAWSLAALLELCPIETHLYKMQDEDDYTKHYYKVGTFDGRGWFEINNTLAIDAVYETVCWLKENNKL